ncbi:MAG TPA: metallophosphoesterase family protein [Anaerovoracaceae bacterium]|nr:metallophosphoesterase family protein [Anaerovoracaceae bacterium]
MKKTIRGFTSFLIIIGLVLGIPVGTDVIAASSGAPSVQAEISISVINNFGEDPATERNFTWDTPPTIKTGLIEYCPRTKFKGFNSNNIIETPALSYESKTDAGSRMIHKISLDNLKPGTEYVYRIRNDNGTVSPQGTFQTAGKKPEQFTFIQITDTQGSNAKDYRLWANTLDKALQKFPDTRFLIHTGDMVDDGQKISQWDLFSDAVKPELMNLPIEPVVGNHEATNKNGTNTNEKNFTDKYSLPDETGTGAPSGTVYSFDYGDAHIAVLNTECSSDNLKKEGDWLQSDMAKSDKPWKIIALHRGLYGATYDSAAIRKIWSPIFDKAGIDLVLQGHDHNYVRTFPMKSEKKVKTGKGTVYLTADSGGVKFYPKKWRSWQAVDLQPNTQMYIAVTVDKDKMVVEAYDVNNNLKDTFTLKK